MKREYRRSTGSKNRQRWLPKPGESAEGDPTWERIDHEVESSSVFGQLLTELDSVTDPGAEVSTADISGWLHTIHQLGEMQEDPLMEAEQGESGRVSMAIILPRRLSAALNIWGESTVRAAEARVRAGLPAIDLATREQFAQIAARANETVRDLRRGTSVRRGDGKTFDGKKYMDRINVLTEDPSILQLEDVAATVKQEIRALERDLRQSIHADAHRALLNISAQNAELAATLADLDQKVDTASDLGTQLHNAESRQKSSTEMARLVQRLNEVENVLELSAVYADASEQLWSCVDAGVAANGNFEWRPSEQASMAMEKMDELIASHADERYFIMAQGAVDTLKAHFQQLFLRATPRDVRVNLDKSTIHRESNQLELHQELRLGAAASILGINPLSTRAVIDETYQTHLRELHQDSGHTMRYPKENEYRMVHERALWLLNNAYEVFVSFAEGTDPQEQK